MTQKKSDVAANRGINALAGNGAPRPVGLSVANPGGISNVFKPALLDYCFGGVAPAAAAANVWVALCFGTTFTGGTTDINAMVNGIAATEVVTTAAAGNWTNYQRAQLPNVNGATGWNAAVATGATQVSTKTNNAIIGSTTLFGAGTNSFFLTAASGGAIINGGGTGGANAQLLFWAIMNSATLSAGANVLAVGSLSGGSGFVINGNQVSAATGQISIGIT